MSCYFFLTFILINTIFAPYEQYLCTGIKTPKLFPPSLNMFLGVDKIPCMNIFTSTNILKINLLDN